MKKILFVFGTRPEAIKMAPVIKCMRSMPDFQSKVCVTAQHRYMLDQVLKIFDIVVDYDLDIMRNNQDLFEITTNVLNGVKSVIDDVKPDMVLVQGDTTTTFAASLAAFYSSIPVGHIEAGLRTYEKYSPFPEEINRHMTSVIADLHFTPTYKAHMNLIKEGVKKERIFITGNTVVDALCEASEIMSSSKLALYIDKNFDFFKNGKEIILITGHRRENFGDGFLNICNAIKKLSEKFSEYNFVYPVHLNPNVREPVYSILKSEKLPNIFLIDPLEYLEFVYLMKKSYMILTDSGGVQEEAVVFGKPVLIMRNNTERNEGLEHGVVKLVGNKEEDIFTGCGELLNDVVKYKNMAKKKNLYGDGKASFKIVDVLRKYLN